MIYGLIYKITNSITGDNYVGQTIQTPMKRWKQHINNSKKGKNPLSRAIRKYGKENFSIEVLEECKTQYELNTQETFWGKELTSLTPNGYNLLLGSGKGSASEETKNKISSTMKGRYAGEKNPMFGKPGTNLGKSPSIESRTKMSAAQIGLQIGNKNGMFGKHHSTTIKKRISLEKIGEKNPLFGKHHSVETKNKMAERKAKTFYFISPLGNRVIITNLLKFCQNKEPSLNPSHMNQVAHEKRKSHKGWTKDFSSIKEIQCQ